MKKRSEEKWWS